MSDQFSQTGIQINGENMKDLISVIVLIYRVEKYLHQCVDSIINQTYKNLEIILVDDGSDDNCPEICDEYARSDRRIKVIHKRNGGIDDARKKGILASTGTYVTYVDGDDWIEPDMHENLIHLATEFDVYVVESGCIDSWGDVEKNRVPFFAEGCYKGQIFSDKIAPKLLYYGNFFSHGFSPYVVTKLFRREKLLRFQLMPEPSNNLVDDIMCTYPCIFQTQSLYITHKCFYHYRARECSAKRKIRADIPSIVMKCYPDWINRFEGALPNANIARQIHYFTMYLLMAKAMGSFDDASSEYYLVPFGKIKKTDRLVLYGAGTVGIHLHHYITKVTNNNPVYWADRNFEQLQGTLDIRDPKKIIEQEYDYVILSIFSEAAVKSAKSDLLSLGIPEEKIVWIDPQYLDNPMSLLKKARYNGEAIIS